MFPTSALGKPTVTFTIFLGFFFFFFYVQQPKSGRRLRFRVEASLEVKQCASGQGMPGVFSRRNPSTGKRSMGKVKKDAPLGTNLGQEAWAPPAPLPSRKP